ncbi:lysine--tRNA ligase, partial [Acidobacteria bacterium AH-259-A15]|nr:lysine--tRNA ligase [Acidobacteria bacterium AH-259-A15]
KTDLIEQRYQKLAEISKLGHDPYPHKYELSHAVRELAQTFSPKSREQLDKEQVSVQTAGRLLTLRGHGKVTFADILGAGERIQVYVRQDRVGEENYQLFRLLDIGDIVGVRGVLLRTKTDELTIFADHLDFLAKALLSLPAKWHGLSDVEIRYRQRYLDLIANPSVREIFIQRSRVTSEIRRFLESKDYLEVETPMMQPIAGGATARPFKTFHEALNMPLFLRIAPELYLKRLIVGGFDRVYEINRNFRNEGISTQHNPEFTMLEFYQAYSNYKDLMDLTEEMLSTVVQRVTGGLELEFDGKQIDLSKFARYSVLETIREFWKGDGVPSTEDLCERERVRLLLQKVGVEFKQDESWGKLLGRLFERVAEDHLIQPTFVYDFPAELSPLAKRKDEDPRFAERFELFIGGLEIANAYSELNDPEEQEKRFEEQVQARARGDQEAHAMDEDYIRALRYGMPPTAGEGVGIDRLIMVLTGSCSIREVILFPHLRPD